MAKMPNSIYIIIRKFYIIIVKDIFITFNPITKNIYHSFIEGGVL